MWFAMEILAMRGILQSLHLGLEYLGGMTGGSGVRRLY